MASPTTDIERWLTVAATGVELIKYRRHRHTQVRESTEQRRIVGPPSHLAEFSYRDGTDRSRVERSKPLRTFNDVIWDVAQMQCLHVRNLTGVAICKQLQEGCDRADTVFRTIRTERQQRRVYTRSPASRVTQVAKQRLGGPLFELADEADLVLG